MVLINLIFGNMRTWGFFILFYFIFLITIGEGGFKSWISLLKILKSIDWLSYKSFDNNGHKDSYVKEITI